MSFLFLVLICWVSKICTSMYSKGTQNMLVFRFMYTQKLVGEQKVGGYSFFLDILKLVITHSVLAIRMSGYSNCVYSKISSIILILGK